MNEKKYNKKTNTQKNKKKKAKENQPTESALITFYFIFVHLDFTLNRKQAYRASHKSVLRASDKSSHS